MSAGDNEIPIISQNMVTADIFTPEMDLTREFVGKNLQGKDGLVLLVYSNYCGACRVFKENVFRHFISDPQSNVVVKCLPLHEGSIGNDFNTKVKNAPVKRFEVMYIPTVLSFDSQGKYFSTYSNGNKERNLEDMREYASRVGDYTVDFEIIKPYGN